MLFSSISFLYYFLAIVIAIYFIVPFKFKNAILLIASLAFYFYGEPTYTLLMLGTTLSSYIHGLLIDKFGGRKLSKIFLLSSIITSVLVLGFFKYSDFFIQNINSIFKQEFSLLRIALPIGISFYTFQTLAYTIDVYRGQAKVQKSFIRLATYVSLFPQLIAGPIVRYTTVEEELSRRTHSFENFAVGINRFIIGLSKKVIIADGLYGFAAALLSSSEPSVALYWLYALSMSLYVYFDFSGYSDMAIGLGRIFGFHFLENFNYPYISKSISEFWRRWHISLGSWFRDYIYIPLGGNRVPKWRWVINILVVWSLTGFWHGADWTFIVWGLYFAAFLMLEKFFLQKLLDKVPGFICHFYVLPVILISFVIFNGNGMHQAIEQIGYMFGSGNLPFWSHETGYYLTSYCFLLIVALLGATPIVKKTVLKLKENVLALKIINILEPIVQVLLLLIVTAYFVDGSFSPFLYFRF